MEFVPGALAVVVRSTIDENLMREVELVSSTVAEIIEWTTSDGKYRKVHNPTKEVVWIVTNENGIICKEYDKSCTTLLGTSVDKMAAFRQSSLRVIGNTSIEQVTHQETIGA